MITIRTFVFNAFGVNTYVLYDETGEAIVVDAACSDSRDEQNLASFLDGNQLVVKRHLNTHCHIDHILGNAFLEDRYGIAPEYHPASSYYSHTAREIAASFGFRLDRIPDPCHLLEDGEVIRWGNSHLKVLYTPGHADGSCCFYQPEQQFVITGDVLFRDSVGRTDLPGGSLPTLMTSIREKLFTLPDDTVVYPGHGPASEIGYEKLNNPFIR